MARFWILALICVVAVLCFNGGLSDDTTMMKQEAPWRIHTLFSVECQNYFDWQTVGLVHSFKKSGQPVLITRLLSCTDEEKKKYKGMNLAPTFEVPSMSKHPKAGKEEGDAGEEGRGDKGSSSGEEGREDEGFGSGEKGREEGSNEEEGEERVGLNGFSE